MTASSERAGADVALRVRGLVKKFGKVQVLRGLDMDVSAGEVYGFLGRNGSGKTTTIRACMGIVAADAGELSILGAVVKRPTVAQKREIGYVSQEQHFYPWMSCAALGRFVGAFYPTWDAAEFVRLLRVFDLPPDRKAAQLSGGMRAKLGLALAMAHRPRLLLLDEPTAGLDPAARREFLDLVRHEARGGSRTTLFSSHIVEEVERIADRVGILDGGRLIYEGGLATLRARVRRFVFAPASTAQAMLFDVDPGPDARTWLPPSFELLAQSDEGGRRSLVLRAAPEAWDTALLPRGEIVPMTIEDIFLTLSVGKQAAA